MGTVAVTKHNTCDDDEVIITTTPNSGYTFVRWSDGTTSYPYTLSVNRDTIITASFISIEIPTPVEDMLVDESTSRVRKVLRDGQLLIIRDGVEYSVMGCKLRIKN